MATIPISQIHASLKKYNPKDIKIATVCSHSALQIFAGARDEGFKTVGICEKKRVDTYKAFPHASPDELIVVDSIKDILKPEIQDCLLSMNAILIPHGSFVEYLGPKDIENKLYVPMLGTRAVLDWEGDRKKERHWLSETAGISMPRVFTSPEDIDCLSIVKFDGAKGGSGYFKVTSPAQYHDEIKKRKLTKGETTIQEYLVGIRYYMHYFYSPLTDKGYPCRRGSLELTGIDRRDESNIDELHRLGMTPKDMTDAGIDATYTVTGNTGCVLRESLLPEVLEIGKKTVDASLKLFSPGMLGPFCLETIVTPDLKIKVFEVSARIVAGTNIYADGSPYSYLFHGKPAVSCARRIALEIKNAAKNNRLSEIIG